MTTHVNQRTGELSDPDAIVARARELDEEITDLDQRIGKVQSNLKALKESREELVLELRAVVRPVPLFDAPRAAVDKALDAIRDPDGTGTTTVTQTWKGEITHIGGPAPA